MPAAAGGPGIPWLVFQYVSTKIKRLKSNYSNEAGVCVKTHAVTAARGALRPKFNVTQLHRSLSPAPRACRPAPGVCALSVLACSP